MDCIVCIHIVIYAIARRFRLAASHLFRHASKPMLCLAGRPDSDPLHAIDGRAASRGVGIELIDILSC